MKYLVLGLLILVMLAAGCLLSGAEIEKRSGAVAGILEAALSAAEAGDEAGTQERLREARTEWDAHLGVLASLLNHEYTDAVTEDLASLERLQGAERIRVCARTLRALRALAKSERPVWRNLF